MLYTGQITFDDTVLHPFVLPAGIPCGRVITLRELTTDTTMYPFNVAAPTSGNSPFPKNQGESVVFNANAGRSGWKAGDIPGWIQPIGATVTFSYIIE